MGSDRRELGRSCRVQIAGRDRPERSVKIDLQRVSGGNFDGDDPVIRDGEEMFDDGAQGVAVGGDQHVLVGLEPRDDRFIPVGQDAVERGLEAFGVRDGLPRIARVAGEIPLAAGCQRRGRNVVAASPDQDLGLAMRRRRLGLVQARQAAVVALIQAPVVDDRNISQTGGVEGQGPRARRPLQHRGEHDRRPEACCSDLFAGAPGLGLALSGEVNVNPAGEPVVEIPLALAMAEQDQAGH